jgi:hypothetical protein
VTAWAWVGISVVGVAAYAALMAGIVTLGYRLNDFRVSLRTENPERYQWETHNVVTVARGNGLYRAGCYCGWSVIDDERTVSLLVREHVRQGMI